MSITSAKREQDRFPDLTDRVAVDKEWVILVRDGKEVAGLVPIEDLELLDELEKVMDLEEIRSSRKEAQEKGTIPWEKLKEDLGLWSMGYLVEFSPHAAREFAKLPRSAQSRIESHIDAIAENPRPPGATKIEGEDNCFRIRVGPYRIIYDIYNEKLWVLVLRVAHRKEVYREKLHAKSVREYMDKKLRGRQ
jgi:mRNA interferase RelE/StbE